MMTKIQNKANQNPKIPIEKEVNLDLANKYNVVTVARLATLRGTTQALKRRIMMILLML